MIKTVEGFHRDGKVELTETIDPAIEPSQVLVTFLDPKKINTQEFQTYLAQLDELPTIEIYSQ